MYSTNFNPKTPKPLIHDNFIKILKHYVLPLFQKRLKGDPLRLPFLFHKNYFCYYLVSPFSAGRCLKKEQQRSSPILSIAPSLSNSLQ